MSYSEPIKFRPTINLIDARLQRAIESMTPTGIAIDHRLISEGDEEALLAEEISAFASSTTKVRRASGAARIVARQLMSQFGIEPQAIYKSTTGAPVWPRGFAGSLAHDDRVAIAALTLKARFQSIGIDIEPAEPIDPSLLDIIAMPDERAEALAEPCRGRLLFAIKEAVYKAINPLEGRFLDHHDVEVNLLDRVARVREGRVVRFCHCTAMNIVVLAYVPPD
jgi:4'-phosphopantetheinyl transferase EntD